MEDKKVVSFIAKDFNSECSFVIDKKITKETLDLCVKNCIHVLSQTLSEYEKYQKLMIEGWKQEMSGDTLKELMEKRDNELKLGEDRIGLVIIWEDHTFITYEEFKKNGLDKYFKDFSKD